MSGEFNDPQRDFQKFEANYDEMSLNITAL